ncbi:MAG: LLM class F420-dependent oxidoreductase [Deltaproteobacteria bacterium]|nr:LLM class F420-dependent oxidoreductase [Deltaproteobacteria bacterium]
MKLGIALPHFGPLANTEAIITVARKAEALGFDSLWVLDRLLWPLEPSSKYPGNPRGEMPTPMQITYDPLTVLSFVAAHTQKVRLGTSVLVAGYRSPVVVAKMASTLDVLSGGRLILGLGSGWSADEFASVGQSLVERNERTDEFLELLDELWGEKAACFPGFEGKYYRVPRSIFLPRPVQKPRPQIWIGGNSVRVLRRVAKFADAWHPTSRLSPAELAQAMRRIRELAREEGRDTSSVALTLRWNAFPDITERSNIAVAAQRLREYREIGIEHICIDLNIPQPVSLAYMIDIMEALMREVVPRI